MKIVNRTYLFNYGGFVSRDSFLSETTMAFEVLEGPAPFKGQKGTQPYEASEVHPGGFVVSWQEQDGGTVVKYFDINTWTVCSYYTDAKLGFHIRTGTFEEELANDKAEQS